MFPAAVKVVHKMRDNYVKFITRYFLCRFHKMLLYLGLQSSVAIRTKVKCIYSTVYSFSYWCSCEVMLEHHFDTLCALGQRVLQDYQRIFIGVPNDKRTSDSNEEKERKLEGTKQDKRKADHGNGGNVWNLKFEMVVS